MSDDQTVPAEPPPPPAEPPPAEPPPPPAEPPPPPAEPPPPPPLDFGEQWAGKGSLPPDLQKRIRDAGG